MVSPKKVPLRIYIKSCIIFSVLYTKLHPISTSFQKEDSILSHLQKKSYRLVNICQTVFPRRRKNGSKKFFSLDFFFYILKTDLVVDLTF